jgi:hypothetical protein
MNGNHQLLVHINNINILGGDLNTQKEKHRSSVTGY